MNKPLTQFSVALTLAVFVAVAQAQKTNPKPLSTPSPGYPAELTDTGMNGQAVIDLTIKADGSVADAAVKSADQSAFGAAALAAIGAWKFEPGTRDGAPIDMRVSLPFKFKAPFEQQVNAAFKRKVFVKLDETPLSLKEFGGKPKVKKNSPPGYPKALAGSGTRGEVEVQYVIAPDGTTINPVVMGKPRAEFVPLAIAAVAQTTYQPLSKDGKGVYVAMTTKLKFTEPAAERGGERGGRRGGRGGGRGGGGGDDFGGGGFGGGMGGGDRGGGGDP